MSRTQKRHPRLVVPVFSCPDVPSAYTSALTKQEFARRLKTLMNLRKMSQSDLARAAFGPERPDSNVPKGRDRVSAYVRGIQFPERPNLELIAQALGVSAEELTPDTDSMPDPKTVPNVPDFWTLEPMLEAEKYPNSTRGRIVLVQDLDMDVIVKIMALAIAHSEASTAHILPGNHSVQTPPQKTEEVCEEFDEEDISLDEQYMEDPFGLTDCLQN